MKICTPTIIALLFPKRYIRNDIEDLDFEGWRNTVYEWKKDATLFDCLKSVEETITSGEGDCEDFAFVVMSYLESIGEEYTLLLFGRGPLIRHVAVQYGDFIYSSGAKHSMTPTEILSTRTDSVWVSERPTIFKFPFIR